MDATQLPVSAAQGLAPPNLAPLPDIKTDASTPDKISKAFGGDAYKSEVNAARENKVLDARTMALVKPPPVPDLKPPPKPEETSPVDAWGSMAMVFAGLASLKVRNHATTAMNAAAEAMKGIKQGDKDRFDQNFKVWEAQNKNAIDLANFQQKAYENLIQSVHHTEDLNTQLGSAESKEAEAKAKALTFAFSDPVAASALAQGWDKFVELQKTRDANKQKLETYKLELSAAGQRASQNMLVQQLTAQPDFKTLETPREKLEYLAEHGVDPVRINEQISRIDEQDKRLSESVGGMADAAFKRWLASPEGMHATEDQQAAKQLEIFGQYKTSGGRVYPKITPENRSTMAQEIAAYRMKMPTASSIAFRNDPDGWNETLKEAEKINPSFNPAKYDLVDKARLKLGAGKDSDAIASYVRLNQHLSLFEKAIEDLPNDVSPIDAGNYITSFFSKQAGMPSVTTYNTMLELVGDEIVKAASGTGTAAALGDREGIKAQFSPNLSKEQLRSNMDAVKGLVGGAIVSTIGKYRGQLSPDEIRDISGLSAETLREYHVDPNTITNTIEGPQTFGGKTVQIGKNGSGAGPEVNSPTPTEAPPTGAGAAATPDHAPPAGSTNIQTSPEGVTMAMHGGQWIVFAPAMNKWVDAKTMQPVQ